MIAVYTQEDIRPRLLPDNPKTRELMLQAKAERLAANHQSRLVAEGKIKEHERKRINFVFCLKLEQLLETKEYEDGIVECTATFYHLSEF